MGARLSALGSPAASDVRVEGGEAHLQIWKDKTRTGRRRIPIHPTIIKLGFMDYVRSLPEDGPLFPGFNRAAYTKRFGGMLDGIGLSDPALVFHSLRHGYKDACRAAGISEEVHDALTGHAGGGVGRSYGRGVPLQVLEAAVKKIEYRGLDMSRL